MTNRHFNSSLIFTSGCDLKVIGRAFIKRRAFALQYNELNRPYAVRQWQRLPVERKRKAALAKDQRSARKLCNYAVRA